MPTVEPFRPSSVMALFKLIPPVTSKRAVASLPPGPMITVPVPIAWVAAARNTPILVPPPLMPTLTLPVKLLFALLIVNVPPPVFVIPAVVPLKAPVISASTSAEPLSTWIVRIAVPRSIAFWNTRVASLVE